MMCCVCGFEKKKGIILGSNSNHKREFVCSQCFLNPSSWFGFVKWRQQKGLMHIHISKKNLNRALNALNDPCQTRLLEPQQKEALKSEGLLPFHKRRMLRLCRKLLQMPTQKKGGFFMKVLFELLKQYTGLTPKKHGIDCLIGKLRRDHPNGDRL